MNVLCYHTSSHYEYITNDLNKFPNCNSLQMSITNLTVINSYIHKNINTGAPEQRIVEKSSLT